TYALMVLAGSNFLMVFIATRGQIELRPKIVGLRDALATYRAGVPIALSSLATTIYGKLDTVLVALLVAPAVAGTYSTYYRVVLAVVGLSSWIAPLSTRYLGEHESSEQYLAKLMQS